MRKYTNQSIDSNTSSAFNELQQKKLEALMNAFSEMDMDFNKELSKEEILDFLDKRVQKEFDRTLANKLFDILDLNNNNSISVEEFMKGYLNFENDIKKNTDELNNKIANERINYNKIDNQCKKYQQEKLNEEGFCENALITVYIDNVEMREEIEGIDRISIKIEYNEQTQETTFKAGARNEVNQRLEFKPVSKKDKLYFIMTAINSQNEVYEIGRKEFNLENIESQEEYEVKIIIPDLKDKNKEIAQIQCRITFFWSDYKLYEDQRNLCEKKINKYENALEKSNFYLQELNEPYGNINNIMSRMASNIDNNILNYENNINNEEIIDDNNNKIRSKLNKKVSFEDNINNNKNNNLNNNYDDTDLCKNYYENFNSDKNSAYGKNEYLIQKFLKRKITYDDCIKYLSIINSILGMLNTFYKNDFPNSLGGLLTLFFTYLALANKNSNSTLNIFKNLLNFLYFLIGYDLVWILLNFSNCIHGIDQYTEGNENGILRWSMFVTFLNEIIKCGIVYSILGEKNKIEKGNKNIMENQNY